MAKCKQSLTNDMYTLFCTHEALCHEYWILRRKGEHEIAELLRQAAVKVADRIKDIHAELLIREATGYE